MKHLLDDIRACDYCNPHLPLGPKPIVSGSKQSKIVLVSQAPGRKAHLRNKAWDDPSGRQLRTWLGVTEAQFYAAHNFAVLPMGFCYPGKGKTGDLPPRKECAPLWHDRMWSAMQGVKLVLLIGKYAQDHYLKTVPKQNLTWNVQHYKDFLPRYFPLPHPSPVNRFWRIRNPWFEAEIVPQLQHRIKEILQ